MPTAHDAAIELRKLADALDRKPEAEILPLTISVYANTSQKEGFLSLASLLPRPLAKKYEAARIEISHGKRWTDTLSIGLYIDRSAVCRVVKEAQPAEYECEPLLSAAEEALLETA